MAGRIKDEDVATVRERAHIDDVVREYVTLKGAGGGSLKGLCPFHDEREFPRHPKSRHVVLLRVRGRR